MELIPSPSSLSLSLSLSPLSILFIHPLDPFGTVFLYCCLFIPFLSLFNRYSFRWEINLHLILIIPPVSNLPITSRYHHNNKYLPLLFHSCILFPLQQCKYIHEVELVNMKLQMRILETHLEVRSSLSFLRERGDSSPCFTLIGTALSLLQKITSYHSLH